MAPYTVEPRLHVPQITWHPHLATNLWVSGEPLENNALNVRIIGSTSIWHPASTSVLFRSHDRTTAQMHREPNSARGPWHSSPSIRMPFARKRCQDSYWREKQTEMWHSKTRSINNCPDITTKQIGKGMHSHACVNVCLLRCREVGTLSNTFTLCYINAEQCLEYKQHWCLAKRLSPKTSITQGMSLLEPLLKTMPESSSM